MMTKRLFLGWMVCLLLLVGVFGVALAENTTVDEPIKVDMEISPNELTGPQTVNVSIKVSNVSDEDLAGAVSLYAPNNSVVTDFGDGGSKMLQAGSSYSWSGTWAVTESQLESGQLTYQVRWPVANAAGDINNQNKFVSAPLTFSGTKEGISVDRTISPTMAKKGQEVSVTYTITNTGNVSVTSLKIAEHKDVASKSYTFKDPLAAGEQVVHTFTVKMGTKDLTSKGTVTYKTSASNKSQKEELDKATISYGEAKLSAKLTASSTGITIGESVKLTLTLANSGNVDYTNVKVTDPTLGEVFTNQEVASGETKLLEKTLVLPASADYTFTITAYDSTNNEVSLVTDKVSITAVDPNQKLNLTLNATVDQMEFVTTEDVIKFKVIVTNASQVDCENVAITAAGKEVYNFTSFKAGDSKSFSLDVNPSMAGTFQFVATTKDQLKNTVTFESNKLQLVQVAPTAAPTDSPVRPVPTLLQDEIPTDDGLPASVGVAQNTLNVLTYVLGGLLGVSLVLLLIASVRRQMAKRASNAAYDHLERATRRDYASDPSDNKNEARHAFPTEEEDDLFGIDLSDVDIEDGDATLDQADEETDAAIQTDEPQEDENADSVVIFRAPVASIDVNAPAAKPEETADEDQDGNLSQAQAAMLSGGDGSYRLSRSASAPVEEAEEPAASAQDFSRRRRSRKSDPPTDVQA